MSYEGIVKNKLSDKAQVIGPQDNGQFSLYTLASLDRWIDNLGKPTIVHWNNGLHDCGHNPMRNPVQIPIEMYISNLKFILDYLKRLTPHVVWATTTPVQPDYPFRNDGWYWQNEEINQYNQASIELMSKYDVPINDMHKLVFDNIDQYLCEDKLHLSELGQEACANSVLEAICTSL
jgi:lysophospholipase L1-like esterase